MKKEARLLRAKAIDSLVLSIEHFNRPYDRGRMASVLILLDHALEMLLKASILHRGGTIREPKATQTIGFDACVRRGLSDAKVRFLTEDQTLTLQAINSLRDAAQHHLVDVSEQHLYIQVQAGLTLFRDIQDLVFESDLRLELPERVLPLSTSVPTDLAGVFDAEIDEIRRLLSPGSRRHLEATSKIRALAIAEAAIQGERLQPSDTDLRRVAKGVREGKAWEDLFPGVASIIVSGDGEGPYFGLRFTKKEGIPVHIVPEGTPGAYPIGLKRVDELGYYNLGRDQLADHIGLSGPKTTAVIRYLDLQSDSDCHKLIAIGKTRFNRYSQKAIERCRECLETCNIEEIWQTHGIRWSREGQERASAP